METVVTNPSVDHSQNEQERMLSVNEDDFEVISEEDDDGTMRENVEKLKNDLEKLVEEKLAVTTEKEEIAEKLRKTQKLTETLNAKIRWLLEAYKCLVDENTIPQVPESLPEDCQQPLKNTRDELSQILQRRCEEKKAKALTVDHDELDFYRKTSNLLVNIPDKSSLEFPSIPENIPEDVQTYLHKYKTFLKSMLQEEKAGATPVENEKWNGDSLSSSFTKVDLQEERTVTHEVTVSSDVTKEDHQIQTTELEAESLPKKKEEENATKLEHEMQMKMVTETYKEKIRALEQQLEITTAEKERAIRRKEEDATKLEHEMQVQMVTDTYQEKIRALEQQLEITKTEKERALRRLSEIAGSNLTDNNPAITDLSDADRPMKIGEQFKELYDNEWTDALCIQTLQMNRTDEEAIQNLLEILQAVSLECQIGSQMQHDQLIDLFKVEGCAEKATGQDRRLSKEDYKKLKAFQKSMAPRYLEQMEKKIFSSEAFKGPLRKEAEQCSTYIRRCLQICWFMYIQDPAMELVFEFYPGQDLDDRLLKAYRKTGSKINYLVWPLLLLHHDGPIVQKGIAEPY